MLHPIIIGGWALDDMFRYPINVPGLVRARPGTRVSLFSTTTFPILLIAEDDLIHKVVSNPVVFTDWQNPFTNVKHYLFHYSGMDACVHAIYGSAYPFVPSGYGEIDTTLISLALSVKRF
ncbi:MAG: hypothetical protein HOO93_17535 [Methyloglobulus sp.]|nr:hypothetical protein [Methyloglobulus sp.]